MTDQPTTPAQVAVKPLEWTKDENRDEEFPAWSAFPDDAASYRIFKAWWGMRGKWGYVCNGGFYHTEQDAKAAAQADYEARIRSALISAPAPAEQDLVAWNGPGEKPHEYSPDYMAMGDCRICGHTRDAHYPAPVPAVPDDVAGLLSEIRPIPELTDLAATIEALAAARDMLGRWWERERHRAEKAEAEVVRLLDAWQVKDDECIRLTEELARKDAALTEQAKPLVWGQSVLAEIERRIALASTALAHPADASNGEDKA